MRANIMCKTCFTYDTSDAYTIVTIISNFNGDIGFNMIYLLAYNHID